MREPLSTPTWLVHFRQVRFVPLCPIDLIGLRAQETTLGLVLSGWEGFHQRPSPFLTPLIRSYKAFQSVGLIPPSVPEPHSHQLRRIAGWSKSVDASLALTIALG